MSEYRFEATLTRLSHGRQFQSHVVEIDTETMPRTIAVNRLDSIAAVALRMICEFEGIGNPGDLPLASYPRQDVSGTVAAGTALASKVSNVVGALRRIVKREPVSLGTFKMLDAVCEMINRPSESWDVPNAPAGGAV